MKFNLISLTILIVLINGCSKSNNDKNEITANGTEKNIEIVKSTSDENKWQLGQDVDQLTGKKTQYISYSSKVTFPKTPEGSVELKVTCIPFQGEYSATTPNSYNKVDIVGSIPNLRLSMYDTPDLFTNSSERFKYSDFRVVLQDDSQDSIRLIESDYSNVYVETETAVRYRFWNLLEPVIRKLIEENNTDSETINKESITATKNKQLKKLEIKFNNGISHIVEFDKNYYKFVDNCINFTKK